MKLIKPTAITTAMLDSSTAPETDYTAWSSVTAYSVGNRCILTSTHRIYECLIANTNASPDVNLIGLTPKWLDIAPTNRWAMFDNVVGTVTTLASPLTVVLNPGAVSGLALLGLVGRVATATLKNAPGGAVVYTKAVDLDGTIITSFYDWFFEPFVQLTDVVFTDIPLHYVAPELTVSLTATSGNVVCGVCKVGEAITIGGTEYGATAGIVDYSVKQRDAFGNYSVVERSFSKRNTFKVETDLLDFNRIFKALTSVRAIPCIWIGTEEPFYEPLLTYGFFKDFSIDVAYPTMNLCSLEIEGLI
jgi:hypothetical protein